MFLIVSQSEVHLGFNTHFFTCPIRRAILLWYPERNLSSPISHELLKLKTAANFLFNKLHFKNYWENVQKMKTEKLHLHNNELCHFFAKMQLYLDRYLFFLVFHNQFYMISTHQQRVSNRNTRKRCEICSKLTIKTP